MTRTDKIVGVCLVMAVTELYVFIGAAAGRWHAGKATIYVAIAIVIVVLVRKVVRFCRRLYRLAVRITQTHVPIGFGH